MPKRSKEDTKITIQIITDAVEDQLVRLGYDKMSYTTLSEQTGISRTGISHHFPKKTDFIDALDSRIYKQFVMHLNLNDNLNEFSSSWLKSLGNPEFVSILRILFHHIVAVEHPEGFVRRGVDRLYSLLSERFGSESKKELEWLLGKTLVQMSF